MSNHADKTQNPKSQLVINEITPAHRNSEPGFMVEDNRSEAVSLKESKTKADQSPQVIQLKAYQEMANNSTQTKELKSYQKIADNYTSQKAQKTGNLPDEIQTKMENSFGEDFSEVTIHTNSKTAEDLNAIAYTQGNDIYFASRYNPYSPQGQEYLGHELSHVIQQKAGIVKTTNQESGYNVNSDDALESMADEAGKRAASGQPAGMNINALSKSENTSIQKKDAPIQLLRLLPAGAPIFELNISNVEGVILTFSQLWNQVSSNLFQSLGGSFRDHPEFPDLVRTVCGGNYFRGSNTYSSEWLDEGFNDILDLGLWDVDTRINMSLMVDNEQVVGTGDGTFSSGGTTTDTRTSAETTTFTGGGTISSAPAGSTGGIGGNVTGSASASRTDTRALASSGTSGLSMSSPAQIRTGNIMINCELKANPTLGSMVTRSLLSAVVGTIRFGAPV